MMRFRSLATVTLALGLALAAAQRTALADEGGVSFWAPGQFGSFAAVPVDPGWALPLVYVHTSLEAGGGLALSRGSRLTVGLDATADLLFAFPTYTFATPVAGAQASLSVGAALARMKANIGGTLTGPFGGTISGSESDSLTGVTDLYAMGTLKWNRGDHNYMVYAMSGAPVGSYSVGRLANVGTNHWSLDAGGGYTYLNPKTGNEFSAVVGFTHSWENPDTNYKNGISPHLDWDASHFVTQQTHLGVVGYYYNQLTGDSGSGATLGDNKSRV